MKKNLKLITCLLLIIAVSASCKKNRSEEPDPEENEILVSATPAGTFTKTQIQSIAVVGGFGAFAPLLNYDVDYVKIIYKTTYKGEPIDASGLLAIPKNVPAAPSLMSAQHGTMFLDAAAPSNFPAPASFSGFELLASTGFITAIPDFIGYGASKDITHPYYDEEHSALAVVDMIKASKVYLEQNKIATSSRLFLFGYSEGGFVTMAAQKEIETNAAHNLTVTAVAAGAGGYDLAGMLNTIATTPVYNEPSFLSFILQSYNTTYEWNRPYTDFFQAPYAGKFPALLDGTKDRVTINSELSTSPTSLFTPAFYANLQNPNQETVLKQALAKNSFPNWRPNSPTRLYHGTADQAVFFATSQTTYARFIAAGAPNLMFFPIPGGTHETSIQPMIANALPWIQSLDK